MTQSHKEQSLLRVIEELKKKKKGKGKLTGRGAATVPEMEDAVMRRRRVESSENERLNAEKP